MRISVERNWVRQQRLQRFRRDLQKADLSELAKRVIAEMKLKTMEWNGICQFASFQPEKKPGKRTKVNEKN